MLGGMNEGSEEGLLGKDEGAYFGSWNASSSPG